MSGSRNIQEAQKAEISRLNTAIETMQREVQGWMNKWQDADVEIQALRALHADLTASHARLKEELAEYKAALARAPLFRSGR